MDCLEVGNLSNGPVMCLAFGVWRLGEKKVAVGVETGYLSFVDFKRVPR